MIRSIIGALVGREIDRRDGSGGAKGALVGMAAMGALRRMGPLGLILGGGYDILGALAVGPHIFAGDRAGMAADAFVQVKDECELSSDS